MNYIMQGAEVYYIPTGKCVAVIDNGKPVMEKGMAGPHSRGVKEFLAELSDGNVPEQPADLVLPGPVVEANVNGDPGEGVYAGWVTGNDAGQKDALPPFDPALGVDTPGFAEFVEGKSAAEIEEVIRKCERSFK